MINQQEDSLQSQWMKFHFVGVDSVSTSRNFGASQGPAYGRLRRSTGGIYSGIFGRYWDSTVGAVSILPHTGYLFVPFFSTTVSYQYSCAVEFVVLEYIRHILYKIAVQYIAHLLL